MLLGKAENEPFGGKSETEVKNSLVQYISYFSRRFYPKRLTGETNRSIRERSGLDRV